MKRKALLLAMVLAAGVVCPAWAKEFKLKDVPDDHWAASAVYDLVKLGVTKGYPDGTYRGSKPINRFETAIFLSKLARAIGSESIKADIKELKDQLLEIKQDPHRPRISGSCHSDWKAGGLLSAGGGRAVVASYRLVLSAEQKYGEDANLKINFDTMDYGFYDDGSSAGAGRGLLASELMDVESNLKVNLSDWRLRDPVYLKLTYGPGSKQHAADPSGALPSEVGVTYRRHNTGVLAATKLFGMGVTGGYLSARSISPEVSGAVKAGLLTASVGFNIGSFKIDLGGDYLSRGLFSSTDRDVKARVGWLVPLGEKTEIAGAVGVGRASDKIMVSGSLKLNDPLDTGTVILVRAAKIGADYLNPAFAAQQFDGAGYDAFDRPLENAIVNLGGEMAQSISERVKLIGKGDLRLAGNYAYQGDKAALTAQGGILYNLAPEVDLDAAYRIYHEKKTGSAADLAAFGLHYRF